MLSNRLPFAPFWVLCLLVTSCGENAAAPGDSAADSSVATAGAGGAALNNGGSSGSGGTSSTNGGGSSGSGGTSSTNGGSAGSSGAGGAGGSTASEAGPDAVVVGATGDGGLDAEIEGGSASDVPNCWMLLLDVVANCFGPCPPDYAVARQEAEACRRVDGWSGQPFGLTCAGLFAVGLDWGTHTKTCFYDPTSGSLVGAEATNDVAFNCPRRSLPAECAPPAAYEFSAGRVPPQWPARVSTHDPSCPISMPSPPPCLDGGADASDGSDGG
jgi:hypothetical protein